MSETKYSVYFGRLGRIPEIRRTQDGGYVCDFSLAINQGKERPPIWKRVVVGEKWPSSVARGSPREARSLFEGVKV